MGKSEKVWHPRFMKYMKDIINHPTYKDLAIETKKNGEYKWVTTAKSKVGQRRIAWCEEKAQQLGFTIQAGVYADVMLELHPTKWKVCQTCGKKMSLYYHYPNANFLKALNRKFGTTFTDCDHIEDIWDELECSGVKYSAIAAFLIEKGNLTVSAEADKETIINAMELACRKGNKKCLGPGAMSNFPDRYDGFHTYNRCCRSTQDKGRSKENMKSYTKDRRAYEYWSDGNIHAANQFMGSGYFTGTTADHIGPICLGFVHDPRYLQPMTGGQNSSKRDRLQLEDIEKIIEIENRTGIYPMSWYAKHIWEYIKANYSENTEIIQTKYRDTLKQNMANFMFILYSILDCCPDEGEDFLVAAYLSPKFEYFNYSYEFNASGEIINKHPRHFTGRNSNEAMRYQRIAVEAVYDYMDKDNRNLTPELSPEEHQILHEICENINNRASFDAIKERIDQLLEQMQGRLIALI